VKRRRDDGGQEAGEPESSDAAAAGSDAEFHEWLEDTAAVDTAAGGGWFGRMFRRGAAPASSTADADGIPPDAAPELEEAGETSAVEASDWNRTTEPGFDSADGFPAPGAPPAAADLWGEAGADEAGAHKDFTSEDYLQATTSEFTGLAEAVARADQEATRRSAVAAEIPGLESGVVGLDDVISATGEGVAEFAVVRTSSDLSIRIGTAIGLLALFAASLLSPLGIGLFIVAVLGLAAGEIYTALIRVGYRPLSLFGFLGIAGSFLGTWAWGLQAIPIALLSTVIAVLLFYATVPGRTAVLENATLTVMAAVWIGGLGGFAFDIINSPNYRWLITALVVTVAVMDVTQYFVGRRIGHRPLAPIVSPKKTIEGYAGGVLAALAVGAAFGAFSPFDLGKGLVLGAVVAVVAPLGDLAVSVLKRAIGVKDMGAILPGHGGVLDRVDAMIFAIPALWIAYAWMGLLN